MARLIYLAIMSLDGSIADADGPTGGRAQAAAIALRDAGAARVAVVVLGHRFDRDFGDGGTYYQQARARNLPGTPVASNRTARRGELLELKVRRRVADGRGKQNRSRVRDSRNHCVLLLGGHCRSGHHPAGGHRALGRRRRTQPQARALRPGRRLHLIASARGRAVTPLRARPRRTTRAPPPRDVPARGHLRAAGPGDRLSTLSEVSAQRLIAASQMIRRSHPGSPIPGAWSDPDNGAYAYQPFLTPRPVR
jgi:hypothetical protein